ncbi:MAG: RNA 2',3'-cyclic phosphodiesterase [Rectinemataceae bacterium]|nr:RNA 2',3'-cyclic phosphodiesterase [Spirochaetaceae bacterium]
MRLFAALPVPEVYIQSLQTYCRELAPLVQPCSPSWVPRGNHHLTLHFFGEVEPDKIRYLASEMESITRAAGMLRIRMGGLHAFPSARQPRVLVIQATVEPSPVIQQLVQSLRRLARDIGAEIDHRPWKAHLTLARCRLPHPLSVTTLPQPEEYSFAAEYVELIESHLERGGARYDILSRFRLPGESEKTKG